MTSTTTEQAVAVIDSFTGKYAFLSNFYLGEPLVYWLVFDTAEHMFNALKTKDDSEAMWVSNAPTPAEAKRRGRQVTLKPGWDATERFRAMRLTLGTKFLNDASLRSQLLATGDAELVEGNSWHDNVWGDCRCGRSACATPGENHLGRLLMELREDLRKWS